MTGAILGGLFFVTIFIGYKILKEKFKKDKVKKRNRRRKISIKCYET